MMQYTVEAPQITEQMRKLDQFNAIAQTEFTAAMRPAIALSLADIHAWAPYATGALDSSVKGEIKFAAGDEVRGVMSATAKAPDGFPYGYALDASSKYAYAGGRKKTKGWLKGVLRRKRAEVLALFVSATSRIVARLAVGDGGESGE